MSSVSKVRRTMIPNGIHAYATPKMRDVTFVVALH
jgi:hypothetical protein